MRKALLAAAIAGLILLLYAAAGYWLAPRFVSDALLGQAERLGLSLQLEDVHTDPFALNVDLTGVRLLADGQPIAHAAGASLDIGWASLWRRGWIVQELSLQRPWVEVVIGPQGALNWPPPPAVAAAPPAENRPTALAVQRLTVSDGAVHFIDRSRGAPVEVTFQALGLQASGLSNQPGEPARYQLSARVAEGGMVSSQGSVSPEPLRAQGKLSMAAVPLSKVWSLAAPDSEAAHGQLHAAASYAYDGERLALSEITLEGARVAHSGVELSQVTLRSPRIVVPSGEPFPISGTASVQAQGRLAAEGTIGVQPFTTDLEVEVADLALAQAQRWLPERARVQIASGIVSARGRLHVQENQESFSYEGAIAVGDARFEEPRSGDLLLAWQRLETQEARLRFSPFAADFGEVAAHGPSGRLVIGEDGRVNFAEVFKDEEGAEEDGPAEKDGPVRVAARRLRIEKGTLDFADRSLDNDFAVTIRALSGTVTGFSTAPGNPARVQLAGRVEQYGSVRIRGTIDLDQPASLANITASFRNVDLAALTPYVVKFAGYRVESGRVSAELRYRVLEGRLVGRNDLTFEQLQLGEKVKAAGARDLPLELAVALLADAEGRINLDIPVSGNLNDPQFDLGGLLARALGNTVRRIVSAPFRALAGLFDKAGTALDELHFEPGAVALTPAAEENVAQVAKALGQRPRLGVTVRGGYDSGTDLEAVKVRTVRRQIARRAGYEDTDFLDLSDPKAIAAAEAMYLERAGNRPEMLKLRESERRYGRALVERLAAAMPVEPGTAEKLGRARAETVRAALLEHGVEPSRVRLEAPAAGEAEKQGVPTMLSLNARPGGAPASAGAPGVGR
jgi:outer membrane protein OmpA-like peptidoglycan-associated protein